MGNEHELMKTIEKIIDNKISKIINDKNSIEYITAKIILLSEQKVEFIDNKKMRIIMNQKIHYEKYKLFGVCGQKEKNDEEKKQTLKYFLSMIYNNIDRCKDVDSIIYMLL